MWRQFVWPVPLLKKVPTIICTLSAGDTKTKPNMMKKAMNGGEIRMWRPKCCGKDSRKCAMRTNVQSYLHDKLGLSLDGRICMEIGHQNSEPGDSGGPLMQLTQNGNIWTQIGVSSISTLKKDFGVAILYTRVSRHCDWIEKNTDGEVKCL
ncbi:hypothetical protein niasHT_037170 [Heterodera trifolii]|uniref:Peptidase S1 domain-containing protein n=1 Tax=Heterodera trifolii TaxID=157864 RepID=A0ABD2I014_9BILA